MNARQTQRKTYPGPYGLPPDRQAATDQQRKMLAGDFVDDHVLRILLALVGRDAAGTPDSHRREQNRDRNLHGEKCVDQPPGNVKRIVAALGRQYPRSHRYHPPWSNRKNNASQRSPGPRRKREVTEPEGRSGQKCQPRLSPPSAGWPRPIRATGRRRLSFCAHPRLVRARGVSNLQRSVR
jgi:hypothetical protein